jgi:pyruvate formate lyase activating enzyme
MKGCRLRCLWCHNPEGISAEQESTNIVNRIGEKEFCREENVGDYYSVDQLLEIISKEKIFIDKSNGGVTFSGGEPLMQSEFLVLALKACKATGYHTTVDTSGYASEEEFKKIIPYTDLFLFDVKHLDDTKHLKGTGVSNMKILSNLGMLIENNCKIMLRIPIIPGFNDDPDYLKRLRDYIILIDPAFCLKVNLLPYHKTGSSKHKRFKIVPEASDIIPPSKERMKEIYDYFKEAGLNVKIGG